MRTCFALILFASSICLAARIPDSAWKTGVLKRVSTDHLAQESGQLGKRPPKHGFYISYYFIEADNHLYEGDDVRLKREEKGFPVTIEQPVKFAISGSDLYIQDSSGKQHKLRLVNSIATASAPSQTAAAQNK